MTVFVYTLGNPIRYVGVTERPIERIRSHWDSRHQRYRIRTAKSRWMRTLTEPPTMIIVAATESRCDAESIERSMIRDLLEEGADLTNESRPAPVGGLLPPTTIGDHPLVGMEITTKTRRADLARVVRLAQRWM